MLNRVKVMAPASSANLGAGFDVLAIALHEPYDVVEVERIGSRKIKVITEGNHEKIPNDVKRNAAGAVAEAMAESFNIEQGMKIKITKGVPVGAGLGSSAASSAGAALAINRMFELGIEELELISYASYGELAVSGVAHKDNVAASLLGGFVVIDAKDEKIFRWAKLPRELRICIAIPVLKLPERKTEYSRSILPEKVSLKDMVDVTVGSAFVVAGFLTGNLEIAGRGMMNSLVDRIRSTLLPGFEEVKKSALKSGASGVCLSGAGPSVMALVNRRKVDAEGVLDAMVSAFKKNGVEAEGFVTRAGGGAKVVQAE